MKGRRVRYRDLTVWQKAHEIAKFIYICSRLFPKEDLYGITSQVRRASLSVPTNIVEGYSRRSDKEFLNFLNIAYGSLAETEYLISFCHELKFLRQEDYDHLSRLMKETGALLWKFMQTIKASC
ncbi:MAG: four helix bundle protein [Candidatus Omnitrophota bacterium]